MWAAQARKILAESSEKEPCSFSCPHKMKSGFAVSLGADLRSPTTRVCRIVPAGTVRAYAARARDYFPFTRKVIKGVPKRRYPLWILLQGDSPLGNFARQSSLPLTSSLAGECQVLHLLLRKTSGYVVANFLLGAWGFKRGLPLSLGVSGPSGPDCVFGDFLHTRKSPQCRARSPAWWVAGTSLQIKNNPKERSSLLGVKN